MFRDSQHEQARTSHDRVTSDILVKTDQSGMFELLKKWQELDNDSPSDGSSYCLRYSPQTCFDGSYGANPLQFGRKNIFYDVT